MGWGGDCRDGRIISTATVGQREGLCSPDLCMHISLGAFATLSAECLLACTVFSVRELTQGCVLARQALYSRAKSLALI